MESKDQGDDDMKVCDLLIITNDDVFITLLDCVGRVYYRGWVKEYTKYITALVLNKKIVKILSANGDGLSVLLEFS